MFSLIFQPQQLIYYLPNIITLQLIGNQKTKGVLIFTILFPHHRKEKKSKLSMGEQGTLNKNI
jgi:hypothetical protein